LLDNPNPKSPANGQAYELFRLHRQRYEDCVRKFADKMRPLEETHGSL
jgi:ubiquitin-protein ligase